MQRLLGQVEIPQQADQGGEDPPRLLAVDLRHRCRDDFPRLVAHQSGRSQVTRATRRSRLCPQPS